MIPPQPSMTTVLRATFDLCEDAIGVHCDGMLTQVNPAAVRLFGYASAEEMVGRPILGHVAPEYRETMGRYIQARAQGLEVPASYELEALRLDGSKFQAEVRAHFFDEGKRRYAMLFVRDVTAEREALSLYRNMFDNNPALKILIDPRDGRILHANPAACEFYGYPHSELVTMRVDQINILPPEEIALRMKQAKEEERSYFEFQHRLKSGEIRDVEVHSSPIRVEGRDCLLSILHDVTERKRLAEQLRQAQKMEALGQLAGGVAHDFNNFLTALLGGCEQVMDVVPPDSPARAKIDRILAGAQTIQDLARQMLTFSRKQAIADPEVTDLAAELERLQPMLRSAVGESVELVLPEPGFRAPVWINPNQFAQVLTNLAINARDAMPTGGQFRLELKADPQAPVEKPTFLLTASDTGSGMTEPVRRRIFEPFFTTKPPGKGTGLGLALVFGIVEHAGGTVEVQSEPGKGTVFRIRLPRTELAPTPRPSEDSLATGNEALETGGRGRIVVVEDDATVRSILVDALTGYGHEVIELATTGEALHRLETGELDHVDALLTDVLMPGMAGPQLADEFRKRLTHLPVLFVSGYTDGAVGDRTRSDPWTAFLAKPFTGRELLVKLAELLSRHKKA